MGGKSGGQVTGYKYSTNFFMFIGNPIEKVLAINFDKRGWLKPLVDKFNNPLPSGYIDSPYLYGENEGGVAGQIHARYGTDNQEVVSFYKEYMESKGLQASAYPFQSYLAFPDFYVGNSGYMKEMLLWPKRTRIRNDGRRQWYEVREDGAVVCEIGSYDLKINEQPNFDWHYNFYPIQYNIESSGGSSPQFSTSSFLKNYHILSFARSNQLDVDETGSFSVELDLESQTGFVKVRIRHVQSNILTKITGWGDLFFEVDGGSDGDNDDEYFNVKYYAIRAGIKAYLTGATSFKTQSESQSYANVEITYLEYVSYSNYMDEHPDINPIHKIREILTDDTAMNKPESSINNDNFVKAADLIWDEGLGISWSITEKSCIDAINEICYHIEAGIRVNRQTGLYEMVLFRNDWFKEDEIHTIAESKIKSMQYEITNADEVINQVNVNYYDRENIKNSSFSISENGLIQTLGRVNAETVDFPYFMNMRNAEIVANWKLKVLSTGAIKGSFTTGWREARKWNRYDLIRLPWSKRWVGTILVRIMSINLGGPTNNEVSIDFIEVVPATGMMNTAIVVDEPIDKPLPPQACQYEPFEMPYYLAVMALGQRQVDDELAYEKNFGLVGAVAEQPQSNSLYAIMKTHNGIEGEKWLRAASINYDATADLDQIISKTSTSFIVKNWRKIANVAAGTLIKCGRDWLGTPGEWMVFQGVDPYTGIVSVKRGALDTPPQSWGFDSKLYFCGNDVAYDATEYVAGEEVLVSALTTTPSGVLELKGSIPVEMKARAIRPYPPANVKFNGSYFPETHTVTNNIVLTWSHRNRVQQTGGEILGWYDGDVTVESAVTYAYELISENVVLDFQSNINTNSVTILSSGLKQNKPHTLKLWSVRDGYESYQKFEHAFFVESASLILTATATKSNVAGNTVLSANISVNVDESLKANMKFDGSSISGKALAGSTITIEIQE